MKRRNLLWGSAAVLAAIGAGTAWLKPLPSIQLLEHVVAYTGTEALMAVDNGQIIDTWSVFSPG